MEDQDSQQRQRGFIDRANGVWSSGRKAYKLFKMARTAGTATETTAGAVATSEIWIPVVIIVLFIVVFFIALTGSGETGEAADIPVSSSINASSCQYTRAGTSSSYQSPTLISYFQEAEKLSGVPATLLAAIAKVETDPTGITDSTLPSLSCAKSSTGATGVMQIQPPGTIGANTEGISQGASFLGKTVDQVNLCNPRENIIIAAGFILNKLHAQKWNPQWNSDKTIIDSIAIGYYGALRYGDPNNPNSGSGPYSYGDDLWNAVSTCGGNQTIGASQQGTLGWTSKIINALEPGTYSIYNRMVTNISNGSYSATKRTGQNIRDFGANGIYWCTFLVIDSYNLAGSTGLSISNHAAVVNMISYWKSNPGLIFLDYRTMPHKEIFKKITPGYAVFFQENPGSSAIGELDHAAIVKSINVDNSTGKGFLETYDANIGGTKTETYPIDGWDLANNLSPLVGFGTTK